MRSPTSKFTTRRAAARRYALDLEREEETSNIGAIADKADYCAKERVEANQRSLVYASMAGDADVTLEQSARDKKSQA